MAGGIWVIGLICIDTNEC